MSFWNVSCKPKNKEIKSSKSWLYDGNNKIIRFTENVEEINRNFFKQSILSLLINSSFNYIA